MSNLLTVGCIPARQRPVISDIVKKKAMTPLLPTILVGLTAFIIMVVIEAIYFVCHLWRCLFDGSALSFSWVEPLPAAGISTGVVLLVTFIATRFMSAARIMSRESGDDPDSIDVRKQQTTTACEPI